MFRLFRKQFPKVQDAWILAHAMEMSRSLLNYVGPTLPE